MTEKYFIFNISGGVGKNIMATAVVEAIKKKYLDGKIIVTTPWTIAWENNPHIERAVSLEKAPLFYKEFIRDRDCEILRLDPYNADDFLHRRKSLTSIWCDLCEVPYSGELPGLYFTNAELEAIRKKIYEPAIHSTNKEPVDPNKPLFFIQPSGGAPNQPYPISWSRDLPIATVEKIVSNMNAAGYRTIHLRRENQIAIPGAEWINFTLREAMGAVKFSHKRLFVDSFGAHAAAAWRLSSVVPWVTNTPVVFGYEMHQNILPDAKEVFRHRMDSYLDAYDIVGRWHEHPYETDQIFDADKITNLLLK